MTTDELFHTLQELGVTLVTHDERLRVNAPAGVLTEALRHSIRQHKAALLVLLTSSAPPSPGHVGRQQGACPQCGETWYWPTTQGTWLCSQCLKGYTPPQSLPPLPPPVVAGALCPRQRLSRRHATS